MQLTFKKWNVIQAEIVAEQLMEETKDINTLEGVITANKNDFVVTGVENEQYPVEKEKFLSKYEKVSGKENVWRKKSGNVMACQLTKDMSVSLGERGTLEGKKGDYLVTSLEEYAKLHEIEVNEKSVSALDMWIVNKDIFPKLYEN